MSAMTLATLALAALVVTWLYHDTELELAASEPAHFAVLNQPPMLDARSYLIFDVATGEIVAGQEIDTIVPIASVTKLPAAAAWRSVVDQTSTTTIAWQDTQAEGRAGKLKVGEAYLNRELLFPLLLESSNDAAAAMERVSDGEVVEKMNEYVHELKLASTTFTDASGLSSLNVSTAYDLAVLTTYLRQQDPHVFDITELSQYLNHKNGWINNNPLFYEQRYRGGKHGYTYEANRTIVAFFDESFKDETRLFGYIILGSNDLTRDIDTLRQFRAGSIRYE